MPTEIQGEVRGNWRHVGPETWSRCANYLSHTARCYDLAHGIDTLAPSSPFAKDFSVDFAATEGIASTRHAGNAEAISGGLGQQGTHIDALGHFGTLACAWDGKGRFPSENVTYFGDLPQRDVKPDPAGPLARLGIDAVPPLVTTGILLDAALHFNVDEVPPGTGITAADLAEMMLRQGLAGRGILPGDVVFIHTGWGRRWRDGRQGAYYASGPGLSVEGAAFLAASTPVVVGLDNPFTDPVNQGQLQGAAGPPAGMHAELPFGTHHLNLVQAGVLQIQNLRLDELARDRVWSFACIVVPLALRGASGSIVRPIAIGTPAMQIRTG